MRVDIYVHAHIYFSIFQLEANGFNASSFREKHNDIAIRYSHKVH
jgi:hypothetical protein